MNLTESFSADKAEFLGALTGDKRVFKKTHGYGHYKGYDASKWVRYITAICLGSDIEWGRRLSGIILREFGVRGTIYWDRDEWILYSSSARLFKGLSDYYQPDWNARKWRVSSALLVSPAEVRRRFVKGYFDADGYPNLSKARNQVQVKVNSVNKQGLDGVKNLLESIGFHPGLYKRYKKRNVWELTIQRKREVFRFLREIGFSITRKQTKLSGMLKCRWPADFN